LAQEGIYLSRPLHSIPAQLPDMAYASQRMMILCFAGLFATAIGTAPKPFSHIDHQRRLCLKDPAIEAAAGPQHAGVALGPKGEAGSLLQGPASAAPVAPHSVSDAVATQEKQLMRSETSNKFSGSWTGSDNARTRVAKRSKDSPKMHIQVYYETKCPYCVLFMNSSLNALWQDSTLRESLNISLYPYGNAQRVPVKNISAGYKFWHPDVEKKENVYICQHGSDECLGNLIQACAIHIAPQEKHMAFIGCMNSKLTEQSVEMCSYDCMDQNGISKTEMQECVNGKQGDDIMADMAKQTDSVPDRMGTPWVLVDGAKLDDPGHLQKAVCDGLDFGPSSCSSYIDPEDYFPVMFQRMLDTVPKNV